MLTKIFRWFKRTPKHAILQKVEVIPRSKHSISRDNISRNALKVLYRIQKAGYQSLLVGGCVRDILLGLHPKDYDIATNAKPEEIQKLFRNCRLIGRRFRLAHIHFGSEIVEVATFRGSSMDNIEDTTDSHAHLVQQHRVHSKEGMILRDNIYGSLEEDVWRRDFTVNGLYYNIADFSVIDFVGGMQDLKTRTLKLIGDPKTRYREDPVRMLRAIRFAAKLDFQIHPESSQPILEFGILVNQVAKARLFDEYLKLFLHGYAFKSYHLLRKYELFKYLFLKIEDSPFIHAALNNTDTRFSEDKPISTTFLLAVILWQPVQNLMDEGMNFYDACQNVFAEQKDYMQIPKRLIQMIREIWSLQLRLLKRKKSNIGQLFSHPRYRTAYDFLSLRAETGDEKVKQITKWWSNYERSDIESRHRMEESLAKSKGKGKKRTSCGQSSDPSV